MSSYTGKQRGALHVWCRECADTLNENQMWYHTPLNPNKVLPWTMLRFNGEYGYLYARDFKNKKLDDGSQRYRVGKYVEHKTKNKFLKIT